MPSLAPLFQLLVRSLSEQEPPRLHQPIPLNELMDAILPYRLVRRELGVDTAEDYETLILRLCAGEGNYLQAEPAAQDALAAELAKPIPDLALLRVWGDTNLVVRTDPMREALADRPERRYAPPTPEPEPTPVEDAEPDEATGGVSGSPAWTADPVVELDSAEEDDDRVELPATEGTGRDAVRCPFCGGLLPPRMAINFCPHCGMGQDVSACRACGADLDVGWRYCVSCGEEVQGGGA